MAYYDPRTSDERYYDPHRNTSGSLTSSVTSGIGSFAKNAVGYMVMYSAMTFAGGVTSKFIGNIAKTQALKGTGTIAKRISALKAPTLGKIAKQFTPVRHAATRVRMATRPLRQAYKKRARLLERVNRKDSLLGDKARFTSAFRNGKTLAATAGNLLYKHGIKGSVAGYAWDSVAGNLPMYGLEEKAAWNVPGHVMNYAKYMKDNIITFSAFGAIGPIYKGARGTIGLGLRNVMEKNTAFRDKILGNLAKITRPRYSSVQAPTKATNSIFKEDVNNFNTANSYNVFNKAIDATKAAGKTFYSAFIENARTMFAEAGRHGSHNIHKPTKGSVTSFLSRFKKNITDHWQMHREQARYGRTVGVLESEGMRTMKTFEHLGNIESTAGQALEQTTAKNTNMNLINSIRDDQLKPKNFLAQVLSLRPTVTGDVMNTDYISRVGSNFAKYFPKSKAHVVDQAMSNVRMGNDYYSRGKFNVDLSMLSPLHQLKRVTNKIMGLNLSFMIGLPPVGRDLSLGNITGWNSLMGGSVRSTPFNKDTTGLGLIVKSGGVTDTRGNLVQRGTPRTLQQLAADTLGENMSDNLNVSLINGKFYAADGVNLTNLNSMNTVLKYSHPEIFGKAGEAKLSNIKEWIYHSSREPGSIMEANKWLTDANRNTASNPFQWAMKKLDWGVPEAIPNAWRKLKEILTPGRIRHAGKNLNHSQDLQAEMWENLLSKRIDYDKLKAHIPIMRDSMEHTGQEVGMLMQSPTIYQEIAHNSRYLQANQMDSAIFHSDEKFMTKLFNMQESALDQNDVFWKLMKNPDSKAIYETALWNPKKAKDAIPFKRQGRLSDYNSMNVLKTQFVTEGLNVDYSMTNMHPFVDAADTLFKQGHISGTQSTAMKMYGFVSTLFADGNLDNFAKGTPTPQDKTALGAVINTFKKRHNIELEHAMDYISRTEFRTPSRDGKLFQTLKETILDPRLLPSVREQVYDKSPFFALSVGDNGSGKFQTGIKKALDIGAERLTNLIKMTTGLRRDPFKYGDGVRGAARFISTRGGQLAAAGLAYKALDALIADNPMLDETALDQGITGFIADNVAKTHLLSSRIANMTGIAGVGRYLDGLMPGFVSSAPGAIVGAALNWRRGITETAVGAVKGAISNRVLSPLMPDMTKTYDQLEAEYSGKEEVPIIEGRMWLMGTTPWQGKRVIGWRPNWYQRMHSRWKASDSLYGSELRKLLHEPIFPVGISVGDIIDPYYMERKHYFSRPYAECIYPQAFVQIHNGIKMVKDIVKGDKIYDVDGVIYNVKDVTSRNVKNNENIHSVNLVGIHEPLIISEDHKQPIIKDIKCKYKSASNKSCVGEHKGICKKCKSKRTSFEIDWVETKDINVGDFLVKPIVRPVYNGDVIQLSKYINFRNYVVEKDICYIIDKNNKKTKTNAQNTFRIDDKIAYYFGLYLAEGWINFGRNKPHTVNTVHNMKEYDYVKTYITHMCSVFKCSYSEEKHDNYVTFHIHNVLLAELIFGLFNKASDKKCIHFTKEIDRKIVAGIIFGDGHYDISNVVLTNTSLNIHGYVTTVLENDMIPICIKKHCNNGKQSYRTSFPYSYLDEYRMKYDSNYKNKCIQTPKGRSNRIYFRNGSILRRVLSNDIIEYKDKLYDIVTDSPKQSFTLLSHCIHNSADFGADIPLGLGPIVSATLGQVIKPKKQMHREFMEGDDVIGDSDFAANPPPTYKEMRGMMKTGTWNSNSIGSRSSFMGTARYGGTKLYGQRMADQVLDNFESAMGLVGFAGHSIRQGLTSDAAIIPTVETAGRIASQSRSYYDMNLGGLGVYCLPYDGKVLTPNGLTNIGEINSGDIVYDQCYSKKKVTNTFSRICDDDERMYTFTLNAGKTQIDCTWNHPLAIYRKETCHDGKVKPCIPNSKKHCTICTKQDKEVYWDWVQAQDVKVGDYAVMPLPKSDTSVETVDLSAYSDYSFSDKYIYTRAGNGYITALEMLEHNPSLTRKQLREYVDDKDAKEALYSIRKNKIPTRYGRYLDITHNIAWFIGWWLAEGSSNIRNEEVMFSLNINELHIAKTLGKIYAESFGGKFRIYEYPDRTICVLVIKNKVLASYLKSFGNVYTKSMNSLVHLSDNKLRALIDGIIQGDGWINHKLQRGGFKSASSKLVRDVWLSLFRLGIQSSITIDYLEKANGRLLNGKVRKDHVRSELQMSRGGYTNYSDVVLNHKKSKDVSTGRVFTRDGNLYIKISNISSLDCSGTKVYDIEVEESHCFIGNYLLLHNSEALRRFVTKPDWREYGVNPIPNLMPNWLPGKFLKGDPFCVTASTMIEVNGNNLKRAEDVTTDDLIRTHTGKLVKPSFIKKRSMKNSESLYRLKVSSLSSFPIEASEEHPIWTESGWKHIKDINIGEYVGYPISDINDLTTTDKILDCSKLTPYPFDHKYIYTSGCDQEFVDMISYIETIQSSFKRGELKNLLFKNNWDRRKFERAQVAVRNNINRRIPRYIDISSPEWGSLIGYYLSEGCINIKDDKFIGVGFAFNINEKEYHDEVMSCLKSVFNIHSKLYQAKGTNGCSVIVNNLAIPHILCGLFGRYFDEKHIGLQHIDSIKETVRTLINGDGSYYFDRGKPRLSLKLENHQLLYQIRQILLSYGYVGYINDNNLIIRGQAAKECALFINTTKYKDTKDSSYTCRHTYIKDGYVWMRVFDNIVIKNENVYGFQVDTDDSFCTAGIATHNTKINNGELRLPGPAYEKTHAGVDKSMPARASMLGSPTEHSIQYFTGLLPPHLKEQYDILETGTRYHEQIQQWLAAENLLVQAEALVYDEKNNISGHVDAIIKDGMGGRGKKALEIKTISEEGLKRLDGPKWQHVGQINFYMNQLKLKKGGILYVSRDNPANFKMFDVNYSHNRLEKDLEKLHKARSVSSQMLAKSIEGDGYGFSYSWLDRLYILSDVAPTSKEYKEAKFIVERQIKAGMLDPDGIAKYHRAKKHRDATVRKYELYPLRFKGRVMSPDTEANIMSINDNIKAGAEYSLPERCFDKDTNIETDKGIKRICDVLIGDYVRTHDNKWKQVYNTSNRNVDHNEKVYEVKVQSREKVKVTEEHPFYVIESKQCHNWSHKDSVCVLKNNKKCSKCKHTYYKEYEHQWIPVKDLTNNHFVATPILDITENSEPIDVYSLLKEYTNIETVDNIIRFSNYNVKGKKQGIQIPRYIERTPELYELFGWYLAEGSRNSAKYPYNGLNFALNSSEENIAQRICYLFNRIFGVRSFSIKNVSDNGINVRIYSSLVSLVFQKLFKHGSNNKYIPSLIYNTSEDNLKSMINAVWLGDGCYNKNRKIIKVISSSLIYDINNLLLTLGYMPSVNFIKGGKKKKIYRNNKESVISDCWTVEWIENPKCTKDRYIHDDYYYTRVLSKKNISIDEVYNIDVIDSNSYIANGLAVHNSIGAAWENFTNTNTFLVNKFFAYKDPLEHYKQYQLYGQEYTPWTDPYGSFIAPQTRTMMAQENPISAAINWGFGLPYLLGGRAGGIYGAVAGGAYGAIHGMVRKASGTIYTPEHMQKERQINDYFDQLKFDRNMRMASLSEGLTRKEYSNQARSTMTSILSQGGKYTDMFRAAQSSEKPYLAAWLDETNPERRDEIARFLPEKMGHAMRTFWHSTDNKMSTRDFLESTSADLANGRKTTPYSMNMLDPTVELEDIKLKTIQNQGLNQHDFGLGWQEQMLRVQNQIDDMQIAEISARPLEPVNVNTAGMKAAIYEMLNQMGLSGRVQLYVNNHSTNNNKVTLTVQRDRLQTLKRSFNSRNRWMRNV